MREISSIMEGTSELIKVIKDTSIYTEYRSSLEDLKKYPELKEMADDFRKENFLMQQSFSEPVSFADVESLEEKRLELVEYPQVDRYLKAELALCRILQDIQHSIISAMDFE